MPHPLDPLVDDGIIDEVLGRLKSGKEADIYRVRREGQIIAAKVYKDRATRSFKSNADYKEGREIRSSRTRRAIEAGSRFGRESEEDAWKSAEADALGKLFAAGLRVPQPIMFYEGVLLMQLVADADGNAAPRLIELTLTPAAANALYVDLRAQIVGMLCLDLIHGDLSPYNILDGAGGATIIDFPQIVSAPHNSRAEFFFRRDFENVREFLAASDPSLLAFRDDARKIWTAYGSRDLTPTFVPSPPGPTPVQRNDRGPQRSGGRDQRDGGNRPPQQHGDNRPRGGATRPPIITQQLDNNRPRGGATRPPIITQQLDNNRPRGGATRPPITTQQLDNNRPRGGATRPPITTQRGADSRPPITTQRVDNRPPRNSARPVDNRPPQQRFEPSRAPTRNLRQNGEPRRTMEPERRSIPIDPMQPIEEIAATSWDRDGAKTAPARTTPTWSEPAPVVERSWRPAPPVPVRAAKPRGGGVERRRPRRRG